MNQNTDNPNSQEKSDKSDTSPDIQQGGSIHVEVVWESEMEKKLEQDRTRIAKENFIFGLEKYLGNIRMSAKYAGVSRETYYAWKRDDPEFAEKAMGIIHQCHDEVEDILKELILARKERSVHFYLKSRHPDYVQKTKVALTDERSLEDLIDEYEHDRKEIKQGMDRDPIEDSGQTPESGGVQAEHSTGVLVESEDEKKHNPESSPKGTDQNN